MPAARTEAPRKPPPRSSASALRDDQARQNIEYTAGDPGDSAVLCALRNVDDVALLKRHVHALVAFVDRFVQIDFRRCLRSVRCGTNQTNMVQVGLCVLTVSSLRDRDR